MGMNAIERILANHSDQDVVAPGDVVVVDVDVTVQFDAARPDVTRVAKPDKLVLLHDHVVPAPTVQAANNAKRLREFVDRGGGMVCNRSSINQREDPHGTSPFIGRARQGPRHCPQDGRPDREGSLRRCLGAARTIKA